MTVIPNVKMACSVCRVVAMKLFPAALEQEQKGATFAYPTKTLAMALPYFQLVVGTMIGTTASLSLWNSMVSTPHDSYE